MDTRPLVRDPLLVHLDAIDLAWRQQQPIDICQLIRQLEPTITAEEQADLIAADLEWRWRSAGFSFRPVQQHGDVQDAFENLQPQLVEQYASDFPRLGESAAALRLLAEAEFIARSRWNDPPLVAAFAQRFTALGDLQPLLLSALDEVTPLLVTLRHDDQVVGRFQAVADVALGRGVPGESLGFADRFGFAADDDSAETAGPERLVIATSSQVTISRTQARWTRLSLDQVRVENTSRNVVMRVASKKLLPGNSCSDYLPLSIHIPPVRIGLELAI